MARLLSVLFDISILFGGGARAKVDWKEGDEADVVLFRVESTDEGKSPSSSFRPPSLLGILSLSLI